MLTRPSGLRPNISLTNHNAHLLLQCPMPDSVVVRMDPVCFLARSHRRQLYQGFVVLCLYCLVSFCVLVFCCLRCTCYFVPLLMVVSTSAVVCRVWRVSSVTCVECDVCRVWRLSSVSCKPTNTSHSFSLILPLITHVSSLYSCYHNILIFHHFCIVSFQAKIFCVPQILSTLDFFSMMCSFVWVC